MILSLGPHSCAGVFKTRANLKKLAQSLFCNGKFVCVKLCPGVGITTAGQFHSDVLTF